MSARRFDSAQHLSELKRAPKGDFYNLTDNQYGFQDTQFHLDSEQHLFLPIINASYAKLKMQGNFTSRQVMQSQYDN